MKSFRSIFIVIFVILGSSCAKKNSSDNQDKNSSNPNNLRPNAIAELNSDSWVAISSQTTLLVADSNRNSEINDCYRLGVLYGKAHSLGNLLEAQAPYWKFSDEKTASDLLLYSHLIQFYSSINECESAKKELPSFHNDINQLRNIIEGSAQPR